MENNVLEISGLNFSFFDSQILKNFSFSLKKGEIHALLGQNATGKSTLVGLLTGRLRPKSGRISIKGKDFSFLDVSTSLRHRIHAIHQAISLFPNLTVAENIFLQSIGGFFHPHAVKRQYKQLCQELAISIPGGATVSSLSLSEQRLVELMRAYVNQPEILLLDEPAAFFTTIETKNMHSILKRIQSQGTSILYITHKIEDAMALSDRISVIFDGTISKTFKPGSLDNDTIIGMMTGKNVQNRFPKIYTEQTGQPLLSVRNLSNSFLHDISFTLRRGEILGITGIAGAGKSQLGKALIGLSRLKSGYVFYHPYNRIIQSVRDAVRYGIGYISEASEKNNVLGFEACKNITLSNLNRISPGKLLHPADEIRIGTFYAKEMHIPPYFPYKPTYEYSGGEQQKISLARAFFQNSQIIILDEPTQFVDIPSKNDIYNMFNSFVSKGNSIIFLSSDFAEVCGMCNRILVLNRGTITAEFSHTEISEEKIISHSLQKEAAL